MDSTSRKLRTGAVTALESAVWELYQFAEHTLPSALKSSSWCEANCKDAFSQAQSCERCCSQIPSEILSKQINLIVQQQPTSTSGYTLTVDFFSRACQLLYVNFLQNPEIPLEILEVVNQSYEALFGLDKLHMMQRKTQHYLDTYDKLAGFLSRECHPLTAVESEASIICEQLKLLDKYKVTSKIKGLMKSGYKYTKIVLYMLLDESCTFPEVIRDVISAEIRNSDGTWNYDRATLIVFNIDKNALIKGISKEIKSSRTSSSKVLELVYLFLRDLSKSAVLVQEDSCPQWKINSSSVSFEEFQELVSIIFKFKDVLAAFNVLLEQERPENIQFWNQLLSSDQFF